MAGSTMGVPSEIPKADHGQWDWLAKMSYATDRWRMSAGYLGMRVNGGGEVDQLERGELRRDSPNDHFAWLRLRGRHTGLWRRSEFFAGSRWRCARSGSIAVLTRTVGCWTQSCLDRFDLAPETRALTRPAGSARLEEETVVSIRRVSAPALGVWRAGVADRR